MATLVWATLMGLASYAKAQTTHVVKVGVEGSFYDPPTTAALEGDIVTFVFGGLIHSVTQSTFQAPCIPLPGGFSSGLAGIGTNGTAPPPTWNLRITNASAPIWFFCTVSVPESHCEQGMVGAINADADSYQSFLAAAKLVSSTPKPTPTVMLSGFGASATASPTPMISPAPGGASTSTQSAASSTGTPSSVFNTSKAPSPKGPIIGGVVGAVAILVIGMLGFFYIRTRYRPRAPSALYKLSLEGKREQPADVFISRNSASGNDSQPKVGALPHLRREASKRLHSQPSSGTLSSPIFSLPAPRAAEGLEESEYGVPGPPNTASAPLDHHAVGTRFANPDPRQGWDPMQRTPVQLEPNPARGPQYDVHEIAREVAAILSPAAPVPARQPQARDDSPAKAIVMPRPIRPLPDPHAHLTSPGMSPRRDPATPAPPQYSRVM